MKQKLFLLLLCGIIFISGCSSQDNMNNAALPTAPSSFPEKSNSENTEPPKPNISIDNIRKEYAELYDSSDMFVDMYIAEKSWLIGEEHIVQLISFAGFNNVSVLPRNSIERIEQASFDDFSNVTVFDKTGKSVSIMVTPEELPKIIALLK